MRLISVRLPTRFLIALIYLLLVRIQNLLMINAQRRLLLSCFLSLLISDCAYALFLLLRSYLLRLRKLFVRTYAYL